MTAATPVAPNQRLNSLQSRADALRRELQEVEASIKAELQIQSNAANGAPSKDSPNMHHRPSWSLLNGIVVPDSEAVLHCVDVPVSGLRDLTPQDEDFATVLKNHPKLKIDPIGRYNHWDRRECAVTNPTEWQDSCKKYIEKIGGTAEIPKVIHQIWVGPKEPPCMWIDTFRVSYIDSHPGWGFHLWSDDQVAKLPMINRQLYTEEKVWQCKADILRLEFLWHYGGLYVDADMVSVGNKSLDPIVELGKETGFVIAYEPDTKDKPYSILGNSVIACTPHHPLILMLILFLKQTYYHKRHVIEVFEVTGPVLYTKCLVDTKMPISIAAQELLYPAFHFVPNPDAIDFSCYPKCLMFQFGYTCSGLEGYVKRKNRCMSARTCPFHAKRKIMTSVQKLSTATDEEIYQQVPISLSYIRDYGKQASRALDLPLDSGILLVVLDGELAYLDELRRQVPGWVKHLKTRTWDVLFLGIEWLTGSDEAVLFAVPPGGRPRNSSAVGLLINTLREHKDGALRPALLASVSDRGFDPTPIFEAAHQLKLWFGAQKYPGELEEARIYHSMSVVSRVFTQLANHSPPMQFDQREVHGDRLKGWLNGYLSFEICAEASGAITYRAWNDDNAPNCEMRANGSKVEWMKVFFNHQVVFEAHNKPIP